MASFITLLAFILDWILGDPQGWPHPVRHIGALIQKLEAWLRAPLGAGAENPARLRRRGAALALLTVGTVMGAAAFSLAVAAAIGSLVWFLLALYLVYSSLCLKDLCGQAAGVEKALRMGDLEEARQRLSWIVGRDTARLDERGVRRAVIETMAENFADGLAAPIFYLTLGGPLLAWGCKAVNTLDSMVGYKNKSYLDLGRFSARLDDLVNYIPARLAALFIIASARLCGHDYRRAWRVWRRDRRLHSSPNSGQPEAAMAGALNLRLGGPSHYGGELVDKPYIFEEGEEATSDMVRAAENIVVGAALLMLSVSALIMFFVTGRFGWFFPA